jgi:hypothetical protein
MPASRPRLVERLVFRAPLLAALAACGHASSPAAAPATDAGDTLEAGVEAEAGAPLTCLPAFGTGAPASTAKCAPVPSPPDALDALLGTAGLDRCLGYQGWEGLFPDGPNDFRLPYFQTLHDTPLFVPSYAQALGADLDAAATSSRPVSQLIAVAQARLGKTITACDPGEDLAAPSGDTAPLAHAIEALVTGTGGTPDAGTIESQADAVPMGLQLALVPIVSLVARGPAVRKTYLGSYASQASNMALLPFISLPNDSYPDLSDATFQKALAAVDLSVLSTYAAELTMAIESANLPSFRDTMGFALSVPTPLGAIVVGDGGAQTYAPTAPNLDGNILLLVDTGGDDTYTVPVGATVGQAASVAIDLGGDDQYGYVEVPIPADTGLLPSDAAGRFAPQQGYGPASLSTTLRQGAGLLGVGILFDYGGGKDHYQSLRVSQGFGAFGVGVLYDDGGDDTYEGEAAVQGSATFGIGILLDAAGNDTRRTFTLSQGYGFTGGVGLLEDLQGDDQYLADVGDPSLGGITLYYSPQLPAAGNSTLSQGAGEGMRDDTNALYWSGGLGILRDVQGGDVYQGSVFAQGVGYWFGIGVLLDGAGDDRYDALWYTQGSAAHAAIGVLWDVAGDDRYGQMWTPKSGNVGTGHDFGEGFLLDTAGNDVMTGGGLSLGEGNDNGLGLLVDTGGTDSFAGSIGLATLDTSTTGGPSFPTYGFFVKAGSAGGDGGADTFAGAPTNRAGTTWRNPAGDAGLEYGLGADEPDGGVEVVVAADGGP